MRLSLSKCTFGVAAGKFLEHLVNQREIEAKLAQVIALIEMTSS